MPNRDDHVVIAGAGPAGSSLAIRLNKLGLPVTLIERHKFPRQKLCGEFISPECLKHFEELGVLDEMLVAGGDCIGETVFYETGGRNISVPSRWFDGGGFALSLSRARMDEILLNAARISGVNVMEGTAVIGLLKVDGSVRGVRVKDALGHTSEIEASISIDATGRARVLSRLADKPIKREEPKPKFVGFKAHLSGVKMDRGVCEIYAFRGGYAGLSFIENGHANLCFLTKASMLSSGNDAEGIFEQLKVQNVRARSTLGSAEKIHSWLAVSVPSFGLSPFPRTGGLLTVGDSAAFVDPFTGSGMLLAMESSSILADCIQKNGIDTAAMRSRYFDTFNARFSSRLKVSGLIRHVAYEPMLSRAAVIALSTSRKFLESLARRTRSTRPTESL